MEPVRSYLERPQSRGGIFRVVILKFAYPLGKSSDTVVYFEIDLSSVLNKYAVLLLTVRHHGRQMIGRTFVRIV